MQQKVVSQLLLKLGITLTGANNTISIDFPGFTTNFLTLISGGPSSAVAMQNSIKIYLFTANKIPVTCTFNAAIQVFTFSNTTINSTFTLSGTLLIVLGFDTAVADYKNTSIVS